MGDGDRLNGGGDDSLVDSGSDSLIGGGGGDESAFPGASDGETPRRGLLIIMSGPSGAGKGTICGELLKRDRGLALSVSATTRRQGPDEAQGREYYFYTEDEFEKLIDEDGFLEWAEVHGNRYGTLKSQVQGIVGSGKDCILEIDVQGGIQVSHKVRRDCVMIFVKAVSEEELIRRITARNRERPDEIRTRMLTARWEMTQEDKYHYSVVNDSLDEVVEQVMGIIREERIAHAAAVDR
jgi:guanylate kinase